MPPPAIHAINLPMTHDSTQTPQQASPPTIDRSKATYFITGTGTGVGKTAFTRGLADCAYRAGLQVAAIKPIETGCTPDAQDARLLAQACHRPHLAEAKGLYRARPPLAPWAVALEGGPTPVLQTLASAVMEHSKDADLILVEGAGGVLVPLSASDDVIDLAPLIDAKVILVATDGLGVLSHSLTAAEACLSRGLELAALVLMQISKQDGSQLSNTEILQRRLPCPVIRWPHTADVTEALGSMAGRLRLLQLLDITD